MNVKQLTQKLRKGFYVDNLFEMAALCRRLAEGETDPVPLYVLRSVFLDVARWWDERPVSVAEAKVVESALAAPAADLVAAMAFRESQDRISRLMTELVSARLKILGGG